MIIKVSKQYWLALRREIQNPPENVHILSQRQRMLMEKSVRFENSRSSSLWCELRGHFILSKLQWQQSWSQHGNNWNINVSLGKGTHSTRGLSLATQQDFSGDINLSSHMGHKANPARNVCSGLFTHQHCTRGSACDRNELQPWETGNTLGKEDALHLSDFVCTQLQIYSTGKWLGNPGLVWVERIKAQQNQDRLIPWVRSSSMSQGGRAQTGTLFLISAQCQCSWNYQDASDLLSWSPKVWNPRQAPELPCGKAEMSPWLCPSPVPLLQARCHEPAPCWQWEMPSERVGKWEQLQAKSLHNRTFRRNLWATTFLPLLPDLPSKPPPGLSPDPRQSCSSLQTLGSVSFLRGITTASLNSTQGILALSEGAAHIPDFISRECFIETPQFVWQQWAQAVLSSTPLPPSLSLNLSCDNPVPHQAGDEHRFCAGPPCSQAAPPAVWTPCVTSLRRHFLLQNPNRKSEAVPKSPAQFWNLNCHF